MVGIYRPCLGVEPMDGQQLGRSASRSPRFTYAESPIATGGGNGKPGHYLSGVSLCKNPYPLCRWFYHTGLAREGIPIPAPGKNANGLGTCVRGSRGAQPPGRESTAAQRRRCFPWGARCVTPLALKPGRARSRRKRGNQWKLSSSGGTALGDSWRRGSRGMATPPRGCLPTQDRSNLSKAPCGFEGPFPIPACFSPANR